MKVYIGYFLSVELFLCSVHSLVLIGDNDAEEIPDTDIEFEPEPEETMPTNTHPYNLEKKKEVVEYYLSGRRRKTEDQLRRKYPLVSLATVKRWVQDTRQGK